MLITTVVGYEFISILLEYYMSHLTPFKSMNVTYYVTSMKKYLAYLFIIHVYICNVNSYVNGPTVHKHMPAVTYYTYCVGAIVVKNENFIISNKRRVGLVRSRRVY